MGPIPDIGLHLLPIPLIITYLFTIAADGDQTTECLDLPQCFLKALLSLTETLPIWEIYGTGREEGLP